jgi:hypothetical protein
MIPALGIGIGVRMFAANGIRIDFSPDSPLSVAEKHWIAYHNCLRKAGRRAQEN